MRNSEDLQNDATELAQDIQDHLEERLASYTQDKKELLLLGMMTSRTLYNAWQNAFDLLQVCELGGCCGKEKVAEEPEPFNTIQWQKTDPEGN